MKETISPCTEGTGACNDADERGCELDGWMDVEERWRREGVRDPDVYQVRREGGGRVRVS